MPKPKYSLQLFIFCLLAEIGAIAWLNSTKTLAQITPDTTLPNNSVVLPNGNTIEITGGTTRGTNLFHSFEQFSLDTGNTAFFDNAIDITNIIGRVTGASISEIDGLIRANGAASLFLINPNGIIFGENAALDLGGSFIGSTADSFKFTDGTEFSAVNPDASPLLTVNIPVGLQYGEQNGDISVEGSGNDLFIDFDTFTVDRSDRPVGLSVQSEKTLALVGGNVFIEGGNLTAPQGNIELGSVAGSGTVELIPDAKGWKLGYAEVNDFQEIGLSQAASLESSGNGGGRVKVKGSFVSLSDGSAILTDTLGDGEGGSLIIEAEETEIYGAADNGFTSSLFTNVDLGATGDGGDLLIDTGYFYVGEGAQINVNTFGAGDAGTLSVIADEIELLGGSKDGNFASGLFAQADIGQTGKGGDININTDYLLVADGAQINVNTFGAGDAGSIRVQANEVESIAGSSNFGASGLFASADFDSTGNGGSLEINTDTLYIADGAQIAVSTFGAGDGGNLTVSANQIELVGTSPGGTPGGLFGNVDFDSTGNGGNLEINTDTLYIADGAQIAVSTFGAGDGGNLTVYANQTALTGTSDEDIPSGLFSSIEEEATGNGGNISIATRDLLINRGAQIAVSTSGAGNAGSLNIEADNVELSGTSGVRPSGLFSNAIIGSGDGGNIDLKSDRLSITDGATISAGNFASNNPDILPGTGTAGNIKIEVDSLNLNSTNPEEVSSITASTNARSGGNIILNVDSGILSNGSQITAETKGDGDGGNINLTADRFSLNSQGQLSVNSTGLGQAGNMAIASDLLTLDEGRITATSTQTGGGEINLTTDSLFLDRNSLISTSVLDSTGGGGNIWIDNSGFIIGQNNSNIKADAVFGQGGNIAIDSTGLFFDASSEITASSQFGVDGVVEINDLESKKIGSVQLPQRISTREAVIVSSCPVPEESTFAVTGLGGLPENPNSYLRGRTVWQDARRLVSDRSATPTKSSSFNRDRSQVTAIVESQTWIINDRGNVELIAAIQATPQTLWQQGIKCGD